MDDKRVLLPTSAELAVVSLVVLVACLLVLLRERRRGGNVRLWFVAFLVAGPFALVVYGLTQFRGRRREG